MCCHFEMRARDRIVTSEFLPATGGRLRPDPAAKRRPFLLCRADLGGRAPPDLWPRPWEQAREPEALLAFSQSLNLKPGLTPSRSSILTRMPAATSSLRNF